MPNYIEDNDVKDQVAAELSLPDRFELEARYGLICPWAATKASNVIRRTLMGRGFSLSQVEDWDDLEEFAVQLSVYWSMVRGMNNGANDVWVEKLKAATEELESLTVLIDGEAVEPAGAGGRVGQGDLDTTNDLITMETEW